LPAPCEIEASKGLHLPKLRKQTGERDGRKRIDSWLSVNSARRAEGRPIQEPSACGRYLTK
jgi:hypothetical protein